MIGRQGMNPSTTRHSRFPLGAAGISEYERDNFPQLASSLVPAVPVCPTEWKLIMPLPDSTYMNRYRKRHIDTFPFVSNLYGSFNTPKGLNRWGALSCLEETWDRENAWFQFRHWVRSQSDPEYRKRLRMLDTGGPFYNRKVTLLMGNQDFDLQVRNSSGNTVLYGVSGPLVARISTQTALNALLADRLEPSSEFALDSAGATAIARCAPAEPHASAYVSIGELYRDGLPSIPGLTTLRSGDIGGEYLNYQFGIAPTISDIKQLSTALYNAKSIYEQYKRDAGRLVRRGYSFPVEENLVSRTVTGNTIPVGGPQSSNNLFWPTKGELVLTVTETTERWFSGAFTYAHLQEDDLVSKMLTQIRKANHLLGVLPSPEALWNLAPWSWAADWVTNIGDVLHNISMYQSDGLMMRWGYIMEHKKRSYEYTYRGGVAQTSSGLQSVNLKQSIVVETKRRRPATPFGFGFELDGLSGRQQAILAALAFSRGKGMRDTM